MREKFAGYKAHRWLQEEKRDMKDDELGLWKRYSQGDQPVREELILRYLYLVKIQVGKISRLAHWANREDLMQEGIKGLITALEGFDPDGGGEFAAYAWKFIRGAIFRNPELQRDLTRRQYDNYRKVINVHDTLMQELGRRPALEEIVEASGLSAGQVMNAFDATSIAFAEGLPDNDSESAISKGTAEIQYERILIKEALSRLGEKEVLILTEHYWGDQSDRAIAEKFGMKEDTVTKTRKRAIKKMRALLEVGKRN
jgi:RNA polymerase sigma factor (sigma-70 family)